MTKCNLRHLPVDTLLDKCFIRKCIILNTAVFRIIHLQRIRVSASADIHYTWQVIKIGMGATSFSEEADK